MTHSAEHLGGKGAALKALENSYAHIPAWFPISETENLSDEDILQKAESLNAEYFAVRSSGAKEDGAEHSFAGQYQTKLYVPCSGLLEAIQEVKESNKSAHLTTYKETQGISDNTSPTVLVQKMLQPVSSGVAFSQNPMTQDEGSVLISALWGVGSALVSGDGDADSWTVKAGQIHSRTIADKEFFHQPDADAAEGTSSVRQSEEKRNLPSLSDDQVLEVAALSLLCEKYFGTPQDIEWAYEGETLFLLQSRPITTLKKEEGELTVWDNSNIAESYSGVTSPLTFSFAERAYEHVYREFCKMLSVPEERIQQHDAVFSKMLGHVQGQVYYNLNSWYQVLALLPGFSINRSFMEQMMGVKEPMPEEIVEKIIQQTQTSPLQDGMNLLQTIGGLVSAHRSLSPSIASFYVRLERALSTGMEAYTTPEELVSHYRDLERQLLKQWDAPLINDFLAMIFYGVLGKLCAKWFDDPSLQNTLLLDCGEIISAEPPKRMQEMAQVLRESPELQGQIVATNEVREREGLILSHPQLGALYTSYLEKFGDRCMEELKLESKTLIDAPAPLIDGLIALAQSPRRSSVEEKPFDVDGLVSGLSLLKRKVFSWVLRHAREKVRNRENLRFERTRLFGRVRQIMLALGRNYTKAGALPSPFAIFFLKLEEALEYQKVLENTAETLALVEERELKQETFLTPPDRFQTRGEIRPELFAQTDETVEPLDELQGVGACPGMVKGRVRVLRSPKDATLKMGEILVAQQTDPGWVVLFPSASALLVERGSLLSHSAIVAREMHIPCIVSVPKITSQLKTGDLVQMNGNTGEIQVLERSPQP